MSNRVAVRLLPFVVADGPHQMAADEVMLESAMAGVASLRVYIWDPPTLSLGYFQRHEDRTRDPRLAALAWIRRTTGGGAIIHEGDLTYAIALPRSVRLSRTPAEWHEHIHTGLARVLAEFEVKAEMVGGQRLPQADLHFLCFAVPQPGDVVLAGQKIAGGAQRVRAGALLQHGSIQVPGLVSQSERFSLELALALGWEPKPGEWTSSERARINQLAAEKYAQDHWNKKR